MHKLELRLSSGNLLGAVLTPVLLFSACGDAPSSGSPETTEEGSPVCSVFAPVSVEVVETAGSAICGSDEVLAEDGMVVGIGYPENTDPLDAYDDVNVVGCLQVDMGAELDVESVRVVARGVESTCGSSCGDACGSGNDVEVFTSVDGSDWNYNGDIELTEDLESQSDDVGENARYLLLCRAGWGYQRNDIEIDYVDACAFEV